MADPALAEALTAWAADSTPAATAHLFAVLVDARLLLPVRAAVISEAPAAATGLRAEKEAELSVLTVDLGDGRQVLPAFTSTDAMRRWRLDARPVEVPVRDACRAALDERWTGLVLDPGSHDFVVGGPAMAALADGFVPVAGDELVSVGQVPAPTLVPEAAQTAAPELVAALRRGVAREPTVAAAWLLRGAPVLEVGLELRAPLDAAGLATVSSRLATRLGDVRFSVAALDAVTARQARERCLQIWP